MKRCIREPLERSNTASDQEGRESSWQRSKGDIHDIGKNIVKVLLNNYSYDVRDLGKDVAPETIVEAAIREQQVRLVGLSALMTTTVTLYGRDHPAAA